jgi:hypothetical protein
MWPGIHRSSGIVHAGPEGRVTLRNERISASHQRDSGNIPRASMRSTS